MHGPRGVMGGGLCNTEIQCRAVLGPECLRLGAAAPPWNDRRECMLVFWGVGGLPAISHGGRVVLARCVEATTVDCLPALTRIPWTLGRLAERPNAPPPQPPGPRAGTPYPLFLLIDQDHICAATRAMNLSETRDDNLGTWLGVASGITDVRPVFVNGTRASDTDLCAGGQGSTACKLKHTAARRGIV